MMFDDMAATYQLDITSEEVAIVKALISGKKDRCPYVPSCPRRMLCSALMQMARLGETMPFLFEIVANERNGLDVDKYVRVLSFFLC